MKSGFLIFAVLLNAGFAALVFWWAYREHKRGRRKE
jgi:cbb3-type cytochrome oxidase subunit 3